MNFFEECPEVIKKKFIFLNYTLGFQFFSSILHLILVIIIGIIKRRN